MVTGSAHCKLQINVAFPKHINTVVLCAVLLVFPVSAQESNQPPVVEVDLRTPDSSTAERQARFAMPDAPSELRGSWAPSTSVPFRGCCPIDTSLTFGPSSAAPELGSGSPSWLPKGPYIPRISRNALAESLRFSIAALDGENTSYQLSQGGGLWNRAYHALVETFTSQTAGGTRIPALSRFAGAYGAAFLANTWYARPSTGFALQRGSAALGSSLGLNLVQELVPHKYLKALHIADPREQRQR